MKKKQINKKLLIVAIIAVLAITIVVMKLVNNQEEQQEVVKNNNQTETGEFVSEIDMSDTTNSEIREDGMKINNSSKIAKGIEFNDTLIEDITIESTGDMAVFNAKVVNNLEKDLEGYIIYLSFLDKDGNVIDKVETLFPDILEGETGFITATTPKDIATAYDIKVERQIQ